MPKYINKNEMYSTIQIGASQVASILNLSPFEDAFKTWQIKTGRLPKPEQTDAMRWGLENEGRTINHYFKANHIDARSMRTQVAAQHRDLPWLRCIADVWQEETGELVQVKSPQSPHLIREIRETGQVPPYGVVQCLTEMSIFEAVSEVFYVVDWTKDPPDVEEKIVTWMDRWQGDHATTNKMFWEDSAIPALKAFWQCILDDAWPEGGYVEPDKDSWAKALKMRHDGQEYIAKGERLKAMGDSKLKAMVGSAGAASGPDLAGKLWKGAWITWRPSYALNIKCESERALREIGQAVEGLIGADGVREIKPDIRPEKRIFRVDKIEEKLP